MSLMVRDGIAELLLITGGYLWATAEDIFADYAATRCSVCIIDVHGFMERISPNLLRVSCILLIYTCNDKYPCRWLVSVMSMAVCGLNLSLGSTNANSNAGMQDDHKHAASNVVTNRRVDVWRSTDDNVLTPISISLFGHRRNTDRSSACIYNKRRLNLICTPHTIIETAEFMAGLIVLSCNLADLC